VATTALAEVHGAYATSKRVEIGYEGLRSRLAMPGTRSRQGAERRAKSATPSFVALDTVVGTEIQKTRPAIIVSNDAMNQFAGRVVVVPVTSNVEQCHPGEALVTIKGKPARALGDQLRSIDKALDQRRRSELSRAREIGAAEDETDTEPCSGEPALVAHYPTLARMNGLTQALPWFSERGARASDRLRADTTCRLALM
jgi:mRNA interferase MazF